MWFFTWFFNKGKEKRHQELLELWEKIKKSEELTTIKLEEIIRKQPHLMDEAIEELFSREKNFDRLLNLYQKLYSESYWEGLNFFGKSKSHKALAASRKIAERLVEYSSGDELYKLLRCSYWPDLEEIAAGKILQTGNVSMEKLETIIFHVRSKDLKKEAAEKVLEKELSDSESKCLVWIIAYAGPPQREKAYDAMMKRKNRKDNLLLLFNMNKIPDNIPFIEMVAKDFLRTNNNEDVQDVQDILFSIIDHVKGDVGRKAAKQLLSLLLNQSSWVGLNSFIWKCGEYSDLQEKAANEILKREKECSDSEIFCCIIRYAPSSWLKKMAAGVILDRFAETKNLKLIMEKVPSLRRCAKEMLGEIEFMESEKPEEIFKRIINF